MSSARERPKAPTERPEPWKLDQFGYPVPARPDHREGESYGRRVTRENNESLEKGRHPVSQRRLLDPAWGYRCGDCAHCFANRRNRTYWKCDLNVTSGPRTDIRKSWPACSQLRLDDT